MPDSPIDGLTLLGRAQTDYPSQYTPHLLERFTTDGHRIRFGPNVRFWHDRPRNVVARFPSLERAVECYNSPAYQAALAHAKGASVRDLMVVEEAE